MLLHVYRIRLRTTGEAVCPAFPGPVLRGALGDDPAMYAALFRPPALLAQRRFADPRAP